MSNRHLPSTKSYSKLKIQVQEVFDFSIVVTQSVPALKRQISLLEKGTIEGLPKPDYYPPTDVSKLRTSMVPYKSQLARYTLISVFSFFESFVTDAIQEMIDSHGGKEEFVRSAEASDRKFLYEVTPEQEKAKQALRGNKSSNKSQRYEKNARQLRESGYRFPIELFSGYGARMLIQKLDNMRSVDIPNLLIQGLHMDIEDDVADEYHRIRRIRNKIAHGENVDLDLKKVAQMNETLKNLAQAIDLHLNLYFIISEYKTK